MGERKGWSLSCHRCLLCRFLPLFLPYPSATLPNVRNCGNKFFIVLLCWTGGTILCRSQRVIGLSDGDARKVFCKWRHGHEKRRKINKMRRDRWDGRWGWWWVGRGRDLVKLQFDDLDSLGPEENTWHVADWGWNTSRRCESMPTPFPP